MSSVVLLTAEPILAKGVAVVLSAVADFDLVSVCYTPTHLLEALSNEPDLLLVDLNAEVQYDFLLEIRKRTARTKVIVWTQTIAPELAYQIIRLGIRGILRKGLPAEIMLRCLQRVSEGECWFDEALTSSFLAARTVKLTSRETDLVVMVSQGLKNKEIATALSISENSVKVYLSKLFRKVGAKDRYTLALYGLKNMLPRQASLPTSPSNGVCAPPVTLLNSYMAAG